MSRVCDEQHPAYSSAAPAAVAVACLSLSLSHTKKNKIFLFRLTEYLVREKIDILSPGYCICCQGKWVQRVELPVELISR